MTFPDEVETFGDAVRWLREQRGLTVRGLARLCGLSGPFISDVEHGRRGTDQVEKIAAALEVDPDALRAYDGRVDSATRTWIAANPKLVKFLRELRGNQHTCECPCCRILKSITRRDTR